MLLLELPLDEQLDELLLELEDEKLLEELDEHEQEEEDDIELEQLYKMRKYIKAETTECFCDQP